MFLGIFIKFSPLYILYTLVTKNEITQLSHYLPIDSILYTAAIRGT